MTLSRDSLVWWFGMLAAVLAAVAAQAELFPPEWKGYINLAALIVGVISGWMKTSPLPGENDAKKIDASKILPAILVMLALGTVACGPPKSVTTDPGKRAWYAAQVLQRVSELQNVAIALESSQALSTSHARLIVEYCVSTAKALKAAPDGWERVALAGFREFKPKLPTEVVMNPAVAAALNVLEAVLVTLAGGAA